MDHQISNLQTKTQFQSDAIIKYNFNKVIEINHLEIKVKDFILQALFKGIDKFTLFNNIKRFVEKEIKKIKLDDINKYKDSIEYWVKFWLDKYYSTSASLLLLMVYEIERTGTKTNGMIKYTPSGKKLPVASAITQFAEIPKFQGDDYKVASSKVANYYNRFKQLTTQFINNGFKELPQLVNGKIIHGRTLFAKTERQVRFEFHKDQLEELRKQGVKLVWINSHANCSKRCEKFQGKLYSLDNTHGVTPDGHNYEPIEKAIDVYVVTKSGNVWRNGLFGFNCRHMMIPYHPGSKAPAMIPKNIIEKERKIDQIMRQMERKIFQLRQEAHHLKGVSFDLKKIKALEKQAAALYQNYVAFAKQNKRVYYPERCRIGLY